MSERSSATEPSLTRLGDRLSGAVVVLLALLLWLVIIPDQVDSASYGWMQPRTLPMIATAAMGLFGAALIVFAAPRPVESHRMPALRLGAVFAVVAIGVLGLGQFGFVIVAPLLAVALGVICGERRWPWLATAALVVPAVIWVIVSVLLSRPLP